MNEGDAVVVGVDAGGTKTDVVVVDRNGVVRGSARGSGANHEQVGLATAEEVLRDALTTALAAAGTRPADVQASAWGLAGVDWPADEAAYRVVLERFGLSGPLVIVNDAMVALRAGIASDAGIVLVSGTGMVAAGRSRDGSTYRTLGVGAGLGDWGSGPDVVREAANAVARAFMSLGPVTALTTLALERSGAADVPALLEAVWRRRQVFFSPADVWEVAASGDAVALTIAERVVSSLTAAVCAVARRLQLDGPDARTYDVILAGRILDPGHPILHDRLVERIRAALPGAQPRRLGVAPVIGAAHTAADAAGWALRTIRQGPRQRNRRRSNCGC